ncbi:MAG: PadR family transcriptional regulator [Acidobacteriota bacterium]
MTRPLSPPVLYILLALADGKLHGYGIMSEVARNTDGRLRLLPGSLYSSLKRMLACGLIEECAGPDESEGPERRYYRITEAGRESAAAELDRMSTLVELGQRKKLGPRPAGDPHG